MTFNYFHEIDDFLQNVMQAGLTWNDFYKRKLEHSQWYIQNLLIALPPIYIPSFPSNYVKLTASGKKLLKRLPEAPNIISHEYYLLDHLGS